MMALQVTFALGFSFVATSTALLLTHPKLRAAYVASYRQASGASFGFNFLFGASALAAVGSMIAIASRTA
tara:strand:+ start:210 stop:419 length:210 start_codon:yes stop_codon:yes gene_type:complete